MKKDKEVFWDACADVAVYPVGQKWLQYLRSLDPPLKPGELEPHWQDLIMYSNMLCDREHHFTLALDDEHLDIVVPEVCFYRVFQIKW